MLKYIANIPKKNIIRNFSSSNYILNRIYTKNEEWIEKKEDYTQIGITKNASQQIGELVYLEYQFKKNDIIKQNEEIVILESVKATDSINAPFNCILVENNSILEEDLTKINENPEDTWVVRINKAD